MSNLNSEAESLWPSFKVLSSDKLLKALMSNTVKELAGKLPNGETFIVRYKGKRIKDEKVTKDDIEVFVKKAEEINNLYPIQGLLVPPMFIKFAKGFGGVILLYAAFLEDDANKLMAEERPEIIKDDDDEPKEWKD